MPPLSDDPVVDFLVLEAVGAKVRHLREKAQEKADSKAFVGSHRELRGLGPGSPAPKVNR